MNMKSTQKWAVLFTAIAYMILSVPSLVAQETGSGTARLQSKVTLTAQGATDLLSTNTAITGRLANENATESRSIKNLCQASLVNASFSPKFQLREKLVGGPTPVGCLTCGNVTYCPSFGECIFTGCGTICNPQD